MGEFTDAELELINETARHFQSDIDLSRVAEIISHPDFAPYDIQLEMMESPSILKEMTPEVWAAIGVTQKRDMNRKIEQGEQELVNNLMSNQYVGSTGSMASYGLQLIKDLDEFWRFGPTIEAIFELSDSQLEKASEYAQAFIAADHENALRSNLGPLVEGYKEWSVEDLSTENINRGLEIYEDCIKIFERGFPNLLAMKRIMDGETPDVDVLQGKSASSVRRELTEDDPESNSVYFDLIVNSFDSRLRNGVAHNDIVMDPAESVVRIPTSGVSYSYERINEIVKENVASGIFVTGTFLSLLEWHAITKGVEGRPERPEWVFGERSVPENLSELIGAEAEDAGDSAG